VTPALPYLRQGAFFHISAADGRLLPQYAVFLFKNAKKRLKFSSGLCKIE
jgi:hypothetical protein